MKPEEAKKLLGGYATGSLTSEERDALFDAALRDQKLFDALADEEALRELLDDDTYRRELVAELAERPSLLQRFTLWWAHPGSLAWAGSAAALVLAAILVYQIGKPPPAQFEVAQVARPSPDIAPAESASTPAPQTERESVEDRDQALGQQLAAAGPQDQALADKVEESVRNEAAAEPAPPPAPAAAPPPLPPAPAKPLAAGKAAPASRMAEVSAEGDEAGMRFRGSQVAAEAVLMRSDTAGEMASFFEVEHAAPEDTWSAVAAGETLALNDRVRLTITAPATGALTVTDAATGETLWTGPVTGGNRYTVPPEGSLPPPAGPGTRRLVVRIGDSAPTVITIRYE